MASQPSGSQLVVVRTQQNSVEVMVVGDSRPAFEIRFGVIVSYNRVCKQGDLEIGDILNLAREGEHTFAVLGNVEVMSGIVKTVDGNQVFLRTAQNIPMNVPIGVIETENGSVAVNDELELFKVRGKFRKVIVKRTGKKQPEQRPISRELEVQYEPNTAQVRYKSREIDIKPVEKPFEYGYKPRVIEVEPEVRPAGVRYASGNIEIQPPKISPPEYRYSSREIPIQPQFSSIELRNPPKPLESSSPPKIASIIPISPYIIPQTYRLDLKNLSSPNISLSLLSQFESYTPCKKDGNSLYRAIAIQYLEYLLRSITDEKDFDSYLKTLESSRYPLVYPISDECRRSYISQLVSLRQKKSSDRLGCMKFLVDLLNDKKFDDGMVAEFRMALGFYYYHNYASLPSEDPDPNVSLQNIMMIGSEGSRIAIACAAKALGVFIKVVNIVESSEEVFEADESERPLLNIGMRGEGYDVLYTFDHNIVDNYNIITKRFNDQANMASYDRSKLFYTTLKPVEQPRLIEIPRIQPSPTKSTNILEDNRSAPSSSIANSIELRPSLSSPPDPPSMKATSPIEELVTCIECKNSVSISELFTDKVCSCNICIRCYYSIRESNSMCTHCSLPLSNKTCTNCLRYIFEEETLNKYCSSGKVCKYCIEAHNAECKKCRKLHKLAEQLLRSLTTEKPKVRQVNSQNNTCDICGRNESLNYGCSHNVCNECLVNYLKFQIDNDTFDFSGIRCLLCESRINPKKFLPLLSQEHRDKFNHNYTKRVVRNLSCPTCSNMFPASVITQACQQCNTALCMRCLKSFHDGDCPIDETFFSIYPRFCQCPNCGKLNGKLEFDTYKKICKNPICGTPYCIDCGALYGPIAIHGENYHKSDCKHWCENPVQIRCDMINCYSCRALGRLCDKPA